MIDDVPQPLPTLSSDQYAILLLWQRVNTSLSAYEKLKKHFGSAKSALKAKTSAWRELKLHPKHLERHTQATAQSDSAFIESIETQRLANDFQIVFQEEAHYPQQLLSIFDPPPLLFYRGNIERLNQHQIAIVGSRKPTQKAQKFTFDLAQYLAKVGFVITSGLAQGVDAQAHLGALAQTTEASGRTIGVMGTGIDVCYPTQHQPLFDRIISEGGCIISELFPGTLPHKHTFPRRNRLVAGLSLGTVVTEAAIKSGSLITARLTSEQGKQVFALPSSIDNTHAEGCHHLIREGATLVYHPDQIINDISCQLLTPMTSNLDESNKVLLSGDFDSVTQSNGLVTSSLFNQAELDSLMLTSASSTQRALQPDIKKPSSPRHKILNNGVPSKSNQSQRHQTDELTALGTVAVSQHLQPLWVHIGFEAQDLDALITKTKLDTASVLSQLMELELIGAIEQVGGRYKRV